RFDRCDREVSIHFRRRLTWIERHEKTRKALRISAEVVEDLSLLIGEEVEFVRQDEIITIGSSTIVPGERLKVTQKVIHKLVNGEDTVGAKCLHVLRIDSEHESLLAVGGKGHHPVRTPECEVPLLGCNAGQNAGRGQDG